MAGKCLEVLVAALPYIGGWLKRVGLSIVFTLGRSTPAAGGKLYVGPERRGKIGGGN